MILLAYVLLEVHCISRPDVGHVGIELLPRMRAFSRTTPLNVFVSAASLPELAKFGPVS